MEHAYGVTQARAWQDCRRCPIGLELAPTIGAYTAGFLMTKPK